MVLPHKMEVQFGDISIFDLGFVAPCHDWTEVEIDQGFCWNLTQVAFLTLQYKGELEVSVEIDDKVEIRPDAIRAIQVPFLVTEHSAISIWKSSDIWYEIPEGDYCLVYQTGLKPVVLEKSSGEGNSAPDWYDMWCTITFVPQANVEARILRRDAKISPLLPLITTEKSFKGLVRLSDSNYANRFYDDEFPDAEST